MATKLSQVNLAALGASILTPKYDRRHLGQGIVHIGVGGFHRAHQTIYTEDLFDTGHDLSWGFCGVGLLPHDARMRDVLRSQNYLYTLVERSAAGDRARVVGSIANFLFAPEEREAVLEKMASSETKIVSLTITEGGYYLHAGTGEFEANHPDVLHDLAHPHEPRCSFGFVLEALARCRSRGQAPFTLMSCDNIQSNGETLKKMLMAFAELRDPSLANWMAQNCLFPNSMVDRITPATTDEHRQLIENEFGIEDGWPVMTEPFKQWVIEDQFVQGRPLWENAGAQITADVLPYEKMKLRLLNASHQALCYIGLILGYEYVHEAMADENIAQLVKQLMEQEVTPILSPVPGIDLPEYKTTLIERFSNPAIRDQLARIGTYGSSGIPKFVLPTIKAQLNQDGPIKLLSFIVASWFRFLEGHNEKGQEMIMNDPMVSRLREIAHRAGTDPQPLLAMRDIFDDELVHTPRFVALVREFLASFAQHGARAALVKALAD